MLIHCTVSVEKRGCHPRKRTVRSTEIFRLSSSAYQRVIYSSKILPDNTAECTGLQDQQVIFHLYLRYNKMLLIVYFLEVNQEV